MKEINFNSDVAPKTIRSLEDIRRSYVEHEIKINGSLDKNVGHAVNDIINANSGKLQELNDKRKIIIQKLDKIIKGIDETGSNFAHVETSVVKSTKQVGGGM